MVLEPVGDAIQENDMVEAVAPVTVTALGAAGNVVPVADTVADT